MLINTRNVFVIEDNQEDFETLKYAINKLDIDIDLTHFITGDDAIDALFNSEKAPSPEIIFLDLNLPGIDGKEVLSQLKSNLTTKKIPVIVLTTSKDPKDIESCYALHANSYIQKPVDLKKFRQTIKQAMTYWIETSTSPYIN